AARVFAAREAGLLHVLLRQRQVARDLLGVVELLGRRAAAGLLIAGEVRWDEAPRGRALGRAAARQDESLAVEHRERGLADVDVVERLHLRVEADRAPRGRLRDRRLVLVLGDGALE